MSTLSEFPDMAAVREQAATWIARKSRGLTSAEELELTRWSATPVNARTLRHMSALWDEMDVMKVLADVIPDAPPAPAPRVVEIRWRPALAASLVVGLAVAGVATYLKLDVKEPVQAGLTQPAASYATVVGEHRSVPLPDGSMLAINTDSQVEVLSMGATARELRLVQGEAHFAVAHDSSRPFRVRVGGRVVQAVGTAFNVRLHADGRLEVAVDEGRVQIYQDQTPTNLLTAGEVLALHANGRADLTRLKPDTLAARLAWRRGMLVFDGQTLGVALDEFARYTSLQFQLTDPKLQQLRIGGYFPAGDTDVLMDTLRTNFGLDCRQGADGIIRIGPGRQTPNG